MNDLRKQDSLKARAARGNVLGYLEKNRGRPQYRPPPSAAKAVNRVLRPLSRKFGPGIGGLRINWPDIIGVRWAALSKPVAMRGSKGAKTLIIEAKGPAAAMIQAQSAQLLDKINQFLGASSVTKIITKQGRIQPSNHPSQAPQTSSAPHKDVQETLVTDEENSLQAALDKLGSVVKPPKTD
ncbi:MAG: DUF721 domain-containing protein [Robiginitomaculum sp.]|nr:DUF721 domain-containing protein [Robiginitomaculum sp.]